LPYFYHIERPLSEFPNFNNLTLIFEKIGSLILMNSETNALKTIIQEDFEKKTSSKLDLKASSPSQLKELSSPLKEESKDKKGSPIKESPTKEQPKPILATPPKKQSPLEEQTKVSKESKESKEPKEPKDSAERKEPKEPEPELTPPKIMKRISEEIKASPPGKGLQSPIKISKDQQFVVIMHLHHEEDLSFLLSVLYYWEDLYPSFTKSYPKTLKEYLDKREKEKEKTVKAPFP